MRAPILLLCLGLAGCVPSPSQLAVEPDDLPRLAPAHREAILAWARGFYAEPLRLRDPAVSDPILIRDGTGRLLWLVCVEANARGADGLYMGTGRHAFGFAPGYVSAPLSRRGAALHRESCERPLTWRPFPALARL